MILSTCKYELFRPFNDLNWSYYITGFNYSILAANLDALISALLCYQSVVLSQ